MVYTQGYNSGIQIKGSQIVQLGLEYFEQQQQSGFKKRIVSKQCHEKF